MSTARSTCRSDDDDKPVMMILMDFFFYISKRENDLYHYEYCQNIIYYVCSNISLELYNRIGIYVILLRSQKSV